MTADAFGSAIDMDFWSGYQTLTQMSSSGPRCSSSGSWGLPNLNVQVAEVGSLAMSGSAFGNIEELGFGKYLELKVSAFEMDVQPYSENQQRRSNHGCSSYGDYHLS